ncbi:alpha/beta fold hydrolase [Streptomyces sp. SID3343]|uniref:thioesterase II family protein n=1 Tax=Streptomyces sp. SID3343 TaxID=2690260 RepID=UPI00136E0632|nr:alpha/beta fold hydrolase [Streptomyces sp. SID3343]MYW04375.1 alpha/beta fold hydrolase [Streptomyces sp. SID3343]
MSTSPVVSDTWIRRFHPAAPSAPRIVCLPHAGGSASYWHPLSAALNDRFQVLAVQYPGRQDRRAEPPIDDIGTLADRITTALQAWLGDDDSPVVLFGHSMGAVLGFEVARRLRVPPAALIVSGRRAPDRYRDEHVHRLDDASLLAEVRSLSGTESSLLEDDEVVRMVLPALRADYRAIETYKMAPGNPLECPITALIGDTDPKVTVDEATSWRDHTIGTFDLHTFTGGHFYLTRHAAAVAQRIATAARAATS